MSETPKLYIAGMGMITPVGFDTASTAAAVRAGISGYEISTSYYGQNDEPITMASVPYMALDALDAKIGEGSRYNDRHDRVIKMAIIAIREACTRCNTKQPVPLVLAMPQEEKDSEGLTPFIENLEQNCQPWISARQHRTMNSGRAAGIEALEYVFRNLNNLTTDFVMIGGSDSYQDYSRIGPLSKDDRLLSAGNKDGFAPGEGAAFLLLTRRPDLALERNGHIVAVNAPAVAEEAGHLDSDEPYRGDGLDRAFKKALLHYEQSSIHSIYSSMNGEHHWAKEYGVAYIRNKSAFADPVKTEHPADCYGDLGSATSPALIALAAEHLFNQPMARAHLVCSSSDTAMRGAVVVEKMPAMANNS